MGLYQDTHINTDQFALLALVFYVTYLAFEMPTGYLMQRLPTAKYLGLNGSYLWPFQLEGQADTDSHFVGHLCHDELRLQELWITHCGESSSWVL